jgi:hypothetical protein
MPPVRSGRALRAASGAALVAALATFYIIAASTHAERVNVSKARADQSGYLLDALILYRNWNGQDPPQLLHRNRMPLYGAYLALFYDPSLAEPDFVPFFVLGRTLNIRLSLVLLGVLYVVFRWHLPRLAAANLTLVIAFGYFVFKAGYTQSELLFYTLFFLSFLVCCQLLEARTARATMALAVLAGGLTGLAHLTKAALLPFVALFLIVCLGSTTWRLVRARHTAPPLHPADRSGSRWRLAGAVVMTVCFLGVMAPYLISSKRVFGRYFYNVNTTFYIWYDNWAQASRGTYSYGDHEGWPTLPRSQLPGPRKYWREHTTGQILARLGGGLQDMVVRSYQTFWIFKYVVLYLAFAAALIWSAPRSFVAFVRDHAAIVVFVAGYGLLYVIGTAFYAPISGTGTMRFLLAHVAPLLFSIAYFATRTRLRETYWTAAGVIVTPQHVQLLIAATIGLDLVFTFWPRLMGTYGGF